MTLAQSLRGLALSAAIAALHHAPAFAGSATTTTLFSDSYGFPFKDQSASFVATVASTDGFARGSVTFKSNGVVLAGCNSLLLAAGQAQCFATFTQYIEYRITAEYSGDASHDASTSAVMSVYARSPTGEPRLVMFKNGTGTGTIHATPVEVLAPVDCPATQSVCALIEPGFFHMNVTAIPGFASAFSGWSGGPCSGSGACTFFLDQDISVTATFSHSPAATTTVLDSTPNPSAVGQQVILKAMVNMVGFLGVLPIPGGSITFTENGNPICSAVPGQPDFGELNAECSVSSLAEGSHAIVAEYSGSPDIQPSVSLPLVQVVQPPGPITVTKAGSGSGRVTSSPPGIDCGTACSANFDTGTVVTLTPQSDDGNQFVGWSGACSGNATCQVTAGIAVAITATFEPLPPPPPPPAQKLAAISTRMQVLTGDDVMIGGFVIGGTSPQRVVVRARGPSLEVGGILQTLPNPRLTIVPAAGGPWLMNDSWILDANSIELGSLGFQLSDSREAAILATLDPGAYTAIVDGVSGTTGIGLVEVYAVDAAADLLGISTRGRVGTGDNVLIGGFIIGGDAPVRVVVRARGPSLGVAGALGDPRLTIVPSAGGAYLVNDDWQQDPNAAALSASGFVPGHPKEAAILTTLAPGAYTVIVNGVNDTTGVAIVEVYVVD